VSPLAPFGTQRGEIASCDLALALRRAQQRRAAESERRAQAEARRRDRIERIKRRLRLA
jgi:hypothetical protein